MPGCTNLYVSAKARGKADGSVERPFATFEAARNALRRRRRRDGLNAPVRVLIEPGMYRLGRPLVFTPEDSGTAECPITWAGDGGRPLLSGARVITGWTEGMINDRPCWQTVLPEVAAGRWWFTQLFVDGRRRLRARLPHQGFYRFAGVPEKEAKLDKGALFHGAMSALFAPGEVRKFKNLDDIDVVVPDHWYDNHLRIKSVNETSRTIHFATRGASRFSRDETGQCARFRLDHVAEGCTEPGDWYLDRATGTLSYIPLPTENIESALVEAPVLDQLLSVRGDPIDSRKRVRHLRFEFLDMRYTDWELPRENMGAGQSAYNVPAAVRLVGAEDCALYGCRVSQVGGWAVEVLRGCHRNRIVACALHDLGGGGVKVAPEGGLSREWLKAFRGMDKSVARGWGPCREDKGGLLPGRDRAEPSATTISDCSIHDGGIIFHSAIGVWIGDAGRNRIVHNHIWNFYYSGISCGWTWGFSPAFGFDNRIEANHIHDIGRGVLSDMGAIYTLGYQPGSSISRNVIHDVYSYGYGGWGIYPDEGSSLLHIEENVVYATKCGGFFQHYGRDNIVRRNCFFDSVENQCAVARRDMVRSMVFERNLVQGSGNGNLLSGNVWKSAWETVSSDRNVYAGNPGRPALFVGKTWAEWQADGHDVKGRVIDAVALDAGGGALAVANPAALKAAGVAPRRVGEVVTAAGPRFRDVLPRSIDAVRREPETRRPIVESRFWPWPAEWPGTHPWSRLPSIQVVVDGEPQPLSLTLENRGDAIARGRYRLKVVPPSAARILGSRELAVALEPGARAELEAHVVATGKAKSFRIEALGEGGGLLDSCLFYTVAPVVEIARLPGVPAPAELRRTLAKLPALPVNGNASPVKASARFAVAAEHLLVHVETADAAPSRGANLWDASSIELFAAPQAGAPSVQLVAAPPVAGQPVAVCRPTSDGTITPVGVAAVGRSTRTGWRLGLSVPLACLGLDAMANAFALDLAINTMQPGEITPRRAHMSCALNPIHNSEGYTRIAVGDHA